MLAVHLSPSTGMEPNWARPQDRNIETRSLRTFLVWIDVNRVRHRSCSVGPLNPDSLGTGPDRLRGSTLCVCLYVRALRCAYLLPCPLSHWVVGRLFDFFSLCLLTPRTKDRSSTRLRHTCIRHPAHGYKPKPDYHSASAPTVFSQESGGFSSTSKR